MNFHSRSLSAVAWAVACFALTGLPAQRAQAQHYDVEASAFGQLEPGTALVIANASGEIDPRFYAEGYVWAGYDYYSDGVADVMVMSVGFRDPARWIDARLGRLMIRSGALRPQHIDGANIALRIPGELRLETFAGVPVVAGFANRGHDWVVGTRLSRAIGGWGSVGVSYAYMRLDGDAADQEVGFDFGTRVTDWLDVNGKLSVDLFSPGVAETVVRAVFRKGIWTTDVFYTDRDPSRMLPSNSLFSALGAYASRRVGTTLNVDAAPRLDVDATGAMRIIDGGLHESVALGALLRLDDEGKGAMGLTLRREGAPDGDWSGIRGTLRLQLVERWLATAEIEIVIPDEQDARGSAWPWGRLGVQWMPAEEWQVDIAMQLSSDPQYRYTVDGLGRVTYRVGGP